MTSRRQEQLESLKLQIQGTKAKLLDLRTSAERYRLRCIILARIQQLERAAFARQWAENPPEDTDGDESISCITW